MRAWARVQLLRPRDRFRLPPGKPDASVLVAPGQFPAAVAGSSGRVVELILLLERSPLGATVVISAMDGYGQDRGRTALAVHWVADRFPDGQVGGELNVPAQRIPPSLDAQAGLYRSRPSPRCG